MLRIRRQQATFHQPHDGMLDEYHVLPGHFLQFQDRFEMTEEGFRFLHLGRVNDIARVRDDYHRMAQCGCVTVSEQAFWKRVVTVRGAACKCTDC